MEAAWREGEESPASEGEEEEDGGGWEYDSTWEDEEEEEEEEAEQLQGEWAQGQAGKGSDAGDPEQTEHPRTLRQLPLCRQPLSARWAPGSQEQRRPHFSFGFGRFKSASERNWRAAIDMQRYRHHYPGLVETDTEASEEEMWNLSFYKNEIPFLPRGLYIDELLHAWQNDYETLERNHSYIQWLFPLREQGMNCCAKLLTCREIQAFRRSKEVMDRFIQVYKLMLGFYGISLINKETGELRRAWNWRERFHNLNMYTHNNLRITRILKCLGELGYEHYQVHLVKFFLTETLVHQTLPRVWKSALDYFMFTVRNKQKRQELVHFAWQHFDQKWEFVWGPRKKLLKFKPRSPEFLSSQDFVEESEAAREGTGDAKGKSQTTPSNKARTAEHTEDRTDHPSSEQGEATEKEATSESSKGGADGESLKESKKRKHEMNKLCEEKVASSKSPTDIESISCNLEEVAIDKSPNCSPEAEETSEPFVPEGGDMKGVKDAESVSAKVKRRKVDEIAPKGCASERTEKAGAEGASSQDHIRNCMAPGIGTDQVSEEEVKVIDTSVEALADCRTTNVNLLDSSRHTTDPGPPSDVSVPDKVDGQGTIPVTESEELQPCERLSASKKEEDGSTGQVEGCKDVAGEEKIPTHKPDIEDLQPKQD